MLQCYDTARPRCTTTATHYDELRPRCAKIHCDLDALRIVYQQCSLIGRSTGRTATSITTADCIGSSQCIITCMCHHSVSSQYHHSILSQCIITMYHHNVSSQCIITVYHHSVSSQCIITAQCTPFLCIITVYHHSMSTVSSQFIIVSTMFCALEVM
jgi:hypothetical protein